MTKDEVNTFAKRLWDYHHLHQPLEVCEAIFTLCSTDKSTAYRAVDLYKQGYGQYLIFSGGTGRISQHLYSEPEARIFAKIAEEQGVPKDRIIVEDKASNTGENIRFTLQLLHDRQLHFTSFILVQKPYMERRLNAVLQKQWPTPQPKIIITSPQLSFEGYVTNHNYDHVVNMMVGDVQRIAEYPKKGFQAEQDIPPDVWDAYHRLVAAGYTKQLIKEG